MPIPSLTVNQRSGALAVLVVLLFYEQTFIFYKRPQQGLEDAAALLSQPQYARDWILVCSDSNGEGGFIVGVAMRDQLPQHVVLRASKFLSANTWSEKEYHPLMSQPQQLSDFLEKYQVDSIVVDRTNALWEQNRNLLLQAVALNPERKILQDEKRPGTARHITIYRRDRQAPKSLQNLRIPLRSTLGRDLTPAQ